MASLAETYNALLAATPRLDALQGVPLDDPRAIEARDAFFDAVRALLSQRLSTIAMTMCVSVKRVEPLSKWDDSHVIDALTIDGVSPVAYAVATNRHDEPAVIRFGTIPVNREGEQLLAAIEEADTMFSTATYHS